MPSFSANAPVLAGAGSFQGSYSAKLFGLKAGLTGIPTMGVVVGSVQRVTITTDDAALPAVTFTDGDGSVIAAQSGLPVNQAQWLVTAAVARAVGGNTFHIVFPNAIHEGTNPNLLIECFNPVGS